jgi:hypothetical protein
MDYEKLCKEIMNLEPKIRFVAILNENGERIAGGFRENTSSLLSPNEVNMSLYYAVQRWAARGHLSHRIGDAKYSTTAYEKVKQITFPVNEKNLLLISIEPSANQLKIIEPVLKLIENN